MDTESEIHSLAGETLALTNVIGFVLHHVAQSSPQFRTAIAAGFDDAASHVENIAIGVGKAASPKHIVKALEIVETMRTVALGKQDKPRHGV